MRKDENSDMDPTDIGNDDRMYQQPGIVPSMLQLTETDTAKPSVILWSTLSPVNSEAAMEVRHSCWRNTTHQHASSVSINFKRKTHHVCCASMTFLSYQRVSYF